MMLSLAERLSAFLVASFFFRKKIKHGAVYYGTDNSGVVYVYTKNGWFAPPSVSKLSDVTSMYGKKLRYHNPTNPSPQL